MIAPYYSDDHVTIYHGDCRDVTEWLEADVLVTDPPYGIAWTKGTNNARQSRSNPGIAGDENTTVRDAALAAWGSHRSAVVFGSFYAPMPANTRQVLAWRKPAGSGVVGSTTGYRRDVEPVYLVNDWPVTTCKWSSLLTSGGNVGPLLAGIGHPHVKPQDVLVSLIERCPFGTIAAPFMGSGSTLVAAKSLGRKAIGIELEERYCEIAAKRCSQEVLDFGATA